MIYLNIIIKTYGGKMSKFCGKCDFCDSIGDVENFIANNEVYAYGHDLVPLKIESEKDLVPLYPYIVRLLTNGKYYLSKRNYIDYHEEEIKSWYLEDILKDYRKAKRKHTEFISKCYSFSEKEVWDAISEVVAKKGEKTTLEDLEDIHTYMGEYYRQIWYEELMRVGWREEQAYHCAYGLRRFIQRIVKETSENDVED